MIVFFIHPPRHNVIGGKQSPILVPTGVNDQSNTGIRPLAELCKRNPRSALLLERWKELL